MVNIKNIIGTSGQQLADGRSWLDFYGDNKPIPGLCPVCGRNGVEVGAHVTVYGYPGTYLAPLCKQCNHYTNTGWMHMVRGMEVVTLDECNHYTNTGWMHIQPR